MGMTILAAPMAADDPTLAMDLPSLIQITRPQLQPDLAWAGAYLRPTTLPSIRRQLFSRRSRRARRPKEAEAFAEPQFPQSIDARRLRPIVPKALPPVPSQYGFLQELSAPATLQALVEKHMRTFHPANYIGDLPVPSSQASSSAAAAAVATVPPPTKGGTVVELTPLNASRFAATRQQQQSLQHRIGQHDQYRLEQARQIANYEELLSGAEDRCEGQAYIDHLKKLLSNEVGRLQDAIADSEKLQAAAVRLEDQVAAIMATAEAVDPARISSH